MGIQLLIAIIGGVQNALPIKTLYVFSFIFHFLLPARVYAVEVPARQIVPIVQNQITIWQMVASSTYPYILGKLISCESQYQNREEIDSNGKMSRGILQFQDGTWAEFAPQADVTGTAMMPDKAIQVAEFMIKHGFLGRWSCAHIQHLVP